MTELSIRSFGSSAFFLFSVLAIEAARAETPAPAAAVKAAAPASAPAPVPAPSPAKAPAVDEVAVVATAAGLVRVHTSDARVEELTPEAVKWCAVDHRAQVLWYLTRTIVAPAAGKANAKAAGETAELPSQLALKAIDLSDPHGTPLEISRSAVSKHWSEVDPLIHYEDFSLGNQLGGYGPGLTLTLHLTSKPKLTAEEVCVAEMPDWCMDDELYGPRPLSKVPEMLRSSARTLRGLRRMQVAPQQMGKLVEFGVRGKQQSQFLPFKTRKLPKLQSLHSSQCKGDACGNAQVIPGTPYWAVTVGSEQGDYYHEFLQFYDPARKVFFDPHRPGVSAKRPFRAENQMEAMLISASGRSFLTSQEVVSFERGVIHKGEHVCGWLEKGWFFNRNENEWD